MNRVFVFALFALGSVCLAHARAIDNDLISDFDFNKIAADAPETNAGPHLPTAISDYGYPVEEHKVETSDGYILTIFRIPHGKDPSKTNGKRPVIFLQHGLIDSSYTWLVNGPNASLGYQLADRGYDVFLGNTRGNQYSVGHVNITSAQKDFWLFEWSDHASKDLPAMLNKALQISGAQKLSYVGHSQGSTIGFAAFSTMPEIAAKIEHFYALCPVLLLNKATTLLIPLLKMCPTLESLGMAEFRPLPSVLKSLPFVCSKWPALCDKTICSLAGCEESNLDPAALPGLFDEYPAATSVRNLNHWNQMSISGRFAAYDFGEAQNLVKYGTKEAPEYPLNKFNVPVSIFFGEQDKLADPEDVKTWVPRLTGTSYVKTFDIESYGHGDFVWGKNQPEKFFPIFFKELGAKKVSSVDTRSVSYEQEVTLNPASSSPVQYLRNMRTSA